MKRTMKALIRLCEGDVSVIANFFLGVVLGILTGQSGGLMDVYELTTTLFMYMFLLVSKLDLSHLTTRSFS